MQTRTLSKEWEGELSLVNYRLPDEILSTDSLANQ